MLSPMVSEALKMSHSYQADPTFQAAVNLLLKYISALENRRRDHGGKNIEAPSSHLSGMAAENQRQSV